MSRSAKGTIENSERNVKGKSGVNKAIFDQGWGVLKRQLDYKQSWRGELLVVVPPRLASRKCSECGQVESDNRRSQAVFQCQACWHTENADTNEAKHILREGHSGSPAPQKVLLSQGIERRVQSDFSWKQEIKSQLVA